MWIFFSSTFLNLNCGATSIGVLKAPDIQGSKQLSKKLIIMRRISQICVNSKSGNVSVEVIILRVDSV